MSKKSAKNQKKQPPYIAIGGVVLAVVVMMALWLGRGGGNSATAAIQNIQPAAYVSQFQNSTTPHLLVDVRTADEFASGHIPGAINIPVDQVGQRLAEFPTDQPIVLYCRSGNRSAQAANTLAAAGYTNLYDLGGIVQWQAAGLPVQ